MEILIGFIFLLALIVIAMYIGLQKKEIVEEKPMPTIHTSGIYSVLRRSPRENIAAGKPSDADVEKWLSAAAGPSGKPLSPSERSAALNLWKGALEKSLAAVEAGDLIGVQRFSLSLSPDCLPCRSFLAHPYYITREDIFKRPELLPPYYPGCRCRLVPESEWTTAIPGLTHLTRDPAQAPPVPDWRQAGKLS